MSRAPPPPPPPPPPSLPFTGGRELPALPPSKRPGSSMSISSMLDSAPTRPLREPSKISSANGASTPSLYTSSGVQLPPAPSPTRAHNSNGFLSRTSPKNHQTSQIPAGRTFRAYSGGTLQDTHATGGSGPSNGVHLQLSPASSVSQYSPTSDAGAQRDWKFQHERSSTTAKLNRPSSQPIGHVKPPLDWDRRKIESEVRLADNARHKNTPIRDVDLTQADSNRAATFDLEGRPVQVERQHPPEREKASSSQISPQEDRLNGVHYPFLTQSSVFSEPRNGNLRAEKELNPTRPLERAYQWNTSVSKGSPSDEPVDQEYQGSHKTANKRTKHGLDTLQQTLDDAQDAGEAHNDSQNAVLGPGTPNVKPSIDNFNQYLRNVDEGLQNHRSMLSLINDNSKRAGRISPLPQAVQGAQGQKRGPSSDPTIKNEFSRMFAGIGSGVGSTGLNSGASTPFPPSPKQNSEADHRTIFTDRGDLIDFAKSRNGSRAGKKSKGVKDDDRKDLEVSEDRMASAKGIRKSRHSQAHHHHTSQSHDKTPRVPTVDTNSAPIMDSVRDLPRRHLGSILYSSSLHFSTSSTSDDSQHASTSLPYTIPRCEGKENHTLTVRIPRFYLSKDGRRRVCKLRAVWGTGIYSDDSDPLAAAIHAGWIRGEWEDGVDFSMLQINASDDFETKETIFTSPPTGPLTPVPDKDLHLTLLILPTLQQYTSSVAYGIKSRYWGDDHDGMSYRVEKIAWVDEQCSRGEERGGESRRKRLKTAFGSRAAPRPFTLGFGQNMGKSPAAA
ncbi:hypothetical protein ACLMJK_005237 [Lecanora helva]